jgi:hypothetical protein
MQPFEASPIAQTELTIKTEWTQVRPAQESVLLDLLIP